MKLMILLVLLTTPVLAKPLVLISYFDAFNGATFNNSERIARELVARLNTAASPVEIKLCSLNTVFDKAYAQAEDCLKALPTAPALMIGLGESTCQLKVESLMRNKDKTVSPDNDGNQRNNTEVIPGAPEFLGMRYPLPQMYCAMSATERNNTDVSNNAGSFVCNNTAYQLSYHYPELQIGFIHVPANNCTNLTKRSEAAIIGLEKMILGGIAYLATETQDEDLPNSTNYQRLPTKKDEIKRLRRQFDNKSCLNEFLKKSKGADERSGFFGILNQN